MQSSEVVSQTVTMPKEEPNPQSRVEIGKRLLILREALGKTQAQMAKLAGLASASAWANYELGDRRIGLDHALRLHTLAGVPIAYIYHGSLADMPADLLEKIDAALASADKTSRAR